MDKLKEYNIFDTARLKVTKLVSTDFEAFHEMQGDAEVMRYTTMRPLSREENKKSIEKVISAYDKEDNDFWVWAVRSSRNEFLGTCAIIVNEDSEWEIGYRLLRKFWGNGFGKEITLGLLKFSKEKMQLNEIFAYVDNRNIPSVKIIESTGFEKIDILTPETGDYLDFKYKIKLT